MHQDLQLTRNSTAPNGGDRDQRLIAGVVSNLRLFRQVAQARVMTVAAHCRVQAVRRGSVLCRRGEPLPGVIALAYGALKLTLRRRDAEEKVIRFLGAGETFGEAAALHDLPCPVDVVSLADSTLVLIPPLPLRGLIETDRQFTNNLLRQLADKFLGLLAEIETGLQRNALQRLAFYLHVLAEPNGSPDRWLARLPASKTAVAARIGITKETMSRILRELTGRGLIAVERGDIVILDRAGLAQAAG
jgi:CRP-like cAMP-binding protein